MGEQNNIKTKKAVKATVITILILAAIVLLLLFFHACKKHTHAYDEGVITVAACAVCGDDYTDGAAEKTAHDYRLVGFTAPTDTACGYSVYTCSVCSRGCSEEIPAEGNSSLSAAYAPPARRITGPCKRAQPLSFKLMRQTPLIS